MLLAIHKLDHHSLVNIIYHFYHDTGDQIGGDEEGEGIVLGVVRYPWEGTDRDYKYDEVC